MGRLTGVKRCHRKHKPYTHRGHKVVVQHADISAEQALAEDKVSRVHTDEKPTRDHPAHTNTKTYTKKITAVGADVSRARSEVHIHVDDTPPNLKLAREGRPYKATKSHDLWACKVRVDLQLCSFGGWGGSRPRAKSIYDRRVEACSKQAQDFEAKTLGRMERIARTAHNGLHETIIKRTREDTTEFVASFFGDGLELEYIHAIFSERCCGDLRRQPYPQQT